VTYERKVIIYQLSYPAVNSKVIHQCTQLQLQRVIALLINILIVIATNLYQTFCVSHNSYNIFAIPDNCHKNYYKKD